MRYSRILHLSISVLFILVMLSCNKDENNYIIKELPVDYFLSENQKVIFENFKADTLITFSNGEGETIHLLLTHFENHLAFPETDYRRGESITVDYRAETGYLPDFGISYDLLALEDGLCQLSITFGTGTYWTESDNDYSFSFFYLNPFNNAKDSIYISQKGLTYEYIDSLSFSTSVYRDLYYMQKGSFTGTGQVINNCYYKINEGVIAFEDLNEKLWVINK